MRTTRLHAVPHGDLHRRPRTDFLFGSRVYAWRHSPLYEPPIAIWFWCGCEHLYGVPKPCPAHLAILRSAP